MNSWIKVPLLALAVLAATCSAENDSSRPHNIVIISIDAFHPDALTRENAPTIYRLMKEGNSTLQGKSVHPPKTLLAHAAMFTGLTPEENRRTSNGWQPGQEQVTNRTIFNLAREKNYRTAYYFSKMNLGYLASPFIDASALSEDSVSDARKFFNRNKRPFIFVHISGLEFIGMDYGWLSREYRAELKEIDSRLAPFIEEITARKNYLIIITSDHAGHGKEHGTDHPEDYRLPFIFYSDIVRKKEIQDKPYSVTMLKGIIEDILK